MEAAVLKTIKRKSVKFGLAKNNPFQGSTHINPILKETDLINIHSGWRVTSFKLITNNLGLYFDEMTPLRDTFQHDNNQEHKSQLRPQTVNVLPWPAVSPDLNPIEKLWDHMDKQIQLTICLNLPWLRLFLEDAQKLYINQLRSKNKMTFKYKSCYIYAYPKINNYM